MKINYSEERMVCRMDWPSGPWDDEPDLVEWTDEATEFPCKIMRNPLGALRGYVGIPIGHPFYGACGDWVNLSVYGGIEFGGMFKDSYWYFGFYCNHDAQDNYPKKAAHFPGEEYKDIDFVKDQCHSLAQQLAKHELSIFSKQG